MHKILKKWRRLKDKEKNQIIILVLALLVTIYVFFIFSVGSAKLQWSENMVSRQKNRMENEQHNINATIPADIGTLQNTAKRLTDEVALARREVIFYRNRLAPIADSDILQSLRVGITNLALASGVIVTSAKHGGIRRIKDDEAPATGEQQTALVKNAFRRPQIALKASANFTQLISFLSALPDLEYDVSVARMSINVKKQDYINYRNEGFRASNSSHLEIDLLIVL
ncbi:MAG: hypothetical protein JKY19_00750 [Alcanivoracaceae bacterium]|nr:hypothetical protein [Alcanivoracaceae bacterium]